MEPLTDAERQFLALAIQGLCMRQGPDLFPIGAQLAEKLGILHEMQGSLQDWLTYSSTSAGARCARCGSPLDNVSPGFSIIASGAAVCTNCLQPGEEIARARSI